MAELSAILNAFLNTCIKKMVSSVVQPFQERKEVKIINQRTIFSLWFSGAAGEYEVLGQARAADERQSVQ